VGAVPQIAREIRIGWADPVLNGLLASLDAASRPCTRHFNQFGDPFLLLGQPYTVPSLPIHHDVRQAEPSAHYLAAVREAVGGIAALLPQAFGGMTPFFDRTDILRPGFYRLHVEDGGAYLFLLRLDLAMKPGEGTVLGRGTADAKPRWSSRKLYVESTLVPLAAVPAAAADGDGRGFVVGQTISDTYLGETTATGRVPAGYERQGIWMDPRLTRFFSWLLLPDGPALYPFLPFPCRFGTVCATSLELSAGGSAAMIPPLRRALDFLVPSMPRIEEALRGTEFSLKLPVFQELKREVPDGWYAPWRGLRVEAYLNENDRKEYRLDG
jgi:hypothetical protein